MPVLRVKQQPDAMPSITLNGCAPIPLAHYLKALGILRLVSEQVDRNATGHWQGEQFILNSHLDCDSLTEFFLRKYQPTPVLNPWNGDGGFFEDSRAGAVEVLKAITESTSDRFAPYRATIGAIRSVFDRNEILEKPADEQKSRVLMVLRGALPSDAIGWIDAVAVLTDSGPKYPPLLGSGGNDGSIDFSKNFMQRLTMILDLATNASTLRADNWLRASLFQAATPAATTPDKIGQFFPGAAGGANASAGFDAKPAVNPWDFVLMIEGTLLFAAASVKRLESAGDGSLVYPFCVSQVGSGYASAARADEEKARCEIWLPLWNQPVTLPELQAVFNEGRAQVRGRPARNGVDFAQAAVTHGVDRGISAFHRYAILERNGQSNFATPLERMIVRRNARVDLLADIEHWHARLRYKADPFSKPKPPASVVAAFNLLERRIFDLCRNNSPTHLQSVIAALGAMERAIARGFKWATTEDKAKRQNIFPLHGLRPEWLDETEQSLEFRLAASVAGMCALFGRGKEKLWFRHHLEPLKRLEQSEYFRASWTEKNSENDVVWHDGDLADTLNAILARRVLRVEQSGTEGWPDDSPRLACLDDITSFIERRTNDALLADLIWGLSLLDWQQVKPLMPEFHDAPDAVPSSFYALLRLCFRRSTGKDDAVPLVPAILQRAMNGDGKAASELSARRLHASGKAPLVKDLPVSGDIARRTAAAILFPISHRDFRLLENMILKPQNQ
jgi:CRISPR-associated protein Csx17